MLIGLISDGLVHQLHHSLAEGAGQIIAALQDWVIPRNTFWTPHPHQQKIWKDTSLQILAIKIKNMQHLLSHFGGMVPSLRIDCFNVTNFAHL